MTRLYSCVHFRGVQHDTCLAGVSMLSVRDDSGEGPYRWPCVPSLRPGETCATTCERREFPTAEQIAEYEQKIATVMRKLEEGVCHQCDVKITGVKQYGPYIYAEPCGHRIGNGDAEQLRRKWNL